MRSHSFRSAVAFTFALLASVATARAQNIATADLQIQGAGLRVITISATTGVDIPASIQTEFGGRQNGEAPSVEGLLAVGELDGPGIDLPIRLETAPGHRFSIPALSREGVYYLRNIRLMKGTEFLQPATPSVATITVSNLLQTAVKVKQLTIEELRARGITLDARNFDVFEYTFSFFIDGELVEIPYSVVIDKRTREVRELPRDIPYVLPPVRTVHPPRWNPPNIYSFGMGGGGTEEGGGDDAAPAGGGGGGGRPSIPAALVLPNNLAVLHQFFAVTLMVTNGAPANSEVTIDAVTAMIRTPTELRVVKSIPAAAFNQPVPVVDANTGVTFLVAQAKGNVDWTVEGLKPGTHTLEVEVRATYRAPGQTAFPLSGKARASIVVHDPRFNINFSHPDTVRKGIDYTTYAFVTNMSAITQTIRLGSGLPSCAQAPGANVCRLEETPEFYELTIPTGEMRMLEYQLRASVTGRVFANAGSVSDEALSASVQLHMGVSESGIPLSPATLVMPYYARYVSTDLVEANLQFLGLGYSLATAPLTQALATQPRVIKTDVYQRATDIARAGQRIFIGEPRHDALAHMSLDLLGNEVELEEWDELRRREKSARGAGAAIARELETDVTDISAFVDRFATKTAHRAGYTLALLHGPKVANEERPYALSVRGAVTGRRLAIPNEAASGWIRELPYAELSRFSTNDRTGELAIVGRWTEKLELTIVPAISGPHTLELIYPAATDGTLLRARVSLDGPAGQVTTITIDRGDLSNNATVIQPEPLALVGARQDLHLDPEAHKVSVLFNRPADSIDWLPNVHGQVILDKDGVNTTRSRPIHAAALQGDRRILHLTFDHALSKNAAYSITVDPFPQPVTPAIDNDRPGGILFGHVLNANNTPIANAEVTLQMEEVPPQFDASADDGSFLFEYVPRDLDNKLSGAYSLSAITTNDKSTSVTGAVRLPGRVHFVNLVFLGHGSAEGVVRYDDGSAVANARVTVGSTMFDQFRKTTTDANGFYRVTDLPVGPLTFTASDADGNVTYGASEIKTPGQVLAKDLSIFRRPFPGTGTIRGVVKRSDTGENVAGALVGVYSQGYGLTDALTDANGFFEFTKVPSGFVTVLAAEWTISRESVALDFDLGNDEVRDVTMTLSVAPSAPLVTIEGDVIREDPLFPADPAKYQKVAGALVKIEHGQTVTADANGHYVIESVPASASGRRIVGYDPLTTRSASIELPQLSSTNVNNVPIFIRASDGAGEGTVRVRVLTAAGLPATGLRVIYPGFPPDVFTELANGIYTLEDVAVGTEVKVVAISNGGEHGDQFAIGDVRVEFNGHVAALTLRLGGQGTVRVKLRADIDIIGDVHLSYPIWDEAKQGVGSKSVIVSTEKNGVADYALFNKVPAIHKYSVSSQHPVYGYAGQSGKLGFDGDLDTITLQLNKLSSVSGVVYAIDGRTPISGASVRMEDGRQDQGTYTTLPDGSFVFHNLPADTSFRVVAEITQDGVYRIGAASGKTPATGGPVDSVSVVMRTQGSVDGRIVYAGYKKFDPQNPANNIADDTPSDLTDNAPVPLARFAMRELDFPRRSFGTDHAPLSADVLGRFTINNVFTGPVRISASDPGNQEMRGAYAGTLSQEGERLTAYVAIGAGGFGSTTITVVDPNDQNAPVFNAEVTLVRGDAVFDFATTDGDGSTQFQQLPAGTYRASAYSKALGRSGASTAFSVDADTDTPVRIVLEFSGEVTGTLTDPEDGGRGVPGSHVTLSAFNYTTRATTDVAGAFLFEGVREGTFHLSAKDTLTNRRAGASRALTQADPRPHVDMELEPTETLYVSVYEPNDTGGLSSTLVPVVDIDVTQRCPPCDFVRSLQGNDFMMPGLLELSPYTVTVTEVGGARRKIKTTASFPVGSSPNPLKLVLQAFGTVEVHVTQAGAPAPNARVTVSGGGRSATVYTDANGVAIATGIGLGTFSAQAVSVDGAFSGSTNGTLSSQSVTPVVNIALGAYAGITGYVEAEQGGPSIGTRVVATFTRVLELFTDSNGRYTFQGIPTGSTVSLVYVGPDDVTTGAKQTVTITAADASKTITVPSVKLDATPPQLLSFLPADGAQDVSPDTSLTFVFSEPIRADQINRNFIQLIAADTSTAINGTYTTFVDENGHFVVRLTPPDAQPFPLASNTLYRIIVSGSITDLTGNRLPGTRGAVFITSDYAEPRVMSTTPAVTTPLQPATTFKFTFNEPIVHDGPFALYKISTAGAEGAIVAELPGRAFVDPSSPLTLVFSPNDALEAQSFYRVVFSGVRDLQGNAAAPQTFHFFSFDAVRPFVVLHSPVPENQPLTSGVEYILSATFHDGDANGPVSTDIARVDFLRVEGTTPVFIKSITAAPFWYRFVAPDVPAEGGSLTLRAEAFDLSANQSEPATITWPVQPNRPPQNVVLALTPESASYANNRVNAKVTFSDEALLATVQVELNATHADGTAYFKSLVKQAKRNTVADPWPLMSFDVDLPATLKEGSMARFTAAVTDPRGQRTTADASLTITEDTTKPVITLLTPASETRFTIGQKYRIEAAAQDLETGVAKVVFSFDNQVITVVQATNGTFGSGDITVPVKNTDTRIPIIATAFDYHGNTTAQTVEVIYAGVNDPAIPKAAWLCPLDHAALPASQAALPLNLQVRATDDIAITAVKFRIPGMSDIAATRVGTTSTYQATVTIATPAAGTPFPITAIVSDADPLHDVELPITIDLADVDIFVDDRIQAITSADVATYENKSIAVRGTTARLVPHVPLTLKNLIVSGGGRVETLSTTTSTEHRLDLTITDRLYVDCASAIDVSNRGYLGGWASNPDGSGTRNNDMRGRTIGNTAEGGATTYAGASHAGVGGVRESGLTNAVYGSIINPTDLGSGGGGGTSCCDAGASGGGAMKLSGGVLAIAGAIRANGGDRNGNGNPASGGSINIAARQFITGPAARITANGGDDDPVNHVSRGAGGGRIAVATDERLEVEQLGVQIAARGGRNATSSESVSYVDAGAGTIYIRRPGQTNGELFVSAFDERYPNSKHLTRATPVIETTTHGTARVSRAGVAASRAATQAGAPDAPAPAAETAALLLFDRVELGPRALVRADAPLTASSIVVDPTAVLLDEDDIPAVTVTTTPDANASLVQGSTLSTTYTAASPAGIGSVTLDWIADRTDSYTTYPASVAPSAIALPIPTSTTPGAIVLGVTAIDRAGRSALTSVPFTIVANTPPVITQFDVVPPAIYPGKSIAATIAASDDLAVTKLTLSTTTGTPATQSVNAGGHTFSVSVPVTTPGGTPMTLTAAAEDGFPGRAATTQTFAVTILTDTIAPSLSVTSPANDATFQETAGATIPVRATATDAEVAVKEVFAQIDGGTPYPLIAGSGGAYSVDIPVPSIDGYDTLTKQLVVTAKDHQGNAVTATIPIRIQPLNDPNAPVVAWSCTSPGAMFPAGYAAKIRIYAIGNDTGNAANGVQKVELFADAATTPVAMTAVTGLTNYYEATYTIPSVADGTVIPIRVVVTNTASLTTEVTSQLMVVSGMVISANTTIAATDTSFDDQTLIVQSGTTTIAGPHSFARLIVLGGAKVTHPATDATTIQRLTVDAPIIYVACDASIDASGLGFTGAVSGYGRTWPNDTAGGSYNGAGGSHGGRGGAHDAFGDSGQSYGSLFDPNEPGGAGGYYSNGTCNPCNAGGGIARITANALVLDGKLLANGINTNSGGGAGGSVRVDATTLSGAGEIRADGATGTHAAGGGGRIAIYAQNLSITRTNITAAGGLHANNTARTGAAGTVFLNNELVIDNADRVSAKDTTLGSGAWNFDQITARRNGTLNIDTLSCPLITTTSTGLVRVIDLQGENVTLRGRVEASGLVSPANLHLQNNALLTHPPTTSTTIHRLTIDADTIDVDATSAIDVSGRGYTGATSGRGLSWTTGSHNGAGGSHGGRGGAHDTHGDSGPTYGSLFDPNLPGAAGGYYSNGTCASCNAGGGIARIQADTIALDGKILANGVNSNSGGGAGGSIRIDAGTLSGSGEIHADGGPTIHAAGGGGRIAIHYDDLTLDRAKITAAGGLHTGNATRTGAAGTIYLKSTAQPNGDLVVDNIGRATNKNTVLTSVGFSTVTNAGASFVSDGSAQFPTPDLLAGIRLVVDHSTVKTWPITGNDANTVTVDVSSDPLSALIGQSFRGLYRFDSVKLRNTRLEVLDLLEGTIDKDASSVVLGSNLVPVLTPSLITLQSNATGASIIGNAGAAVDPDQPLVLTATNTTSGASWTINAAANGSFTISVQGNAGEAITLKGRDSNYFPLESPLLNVGTLAADTPPPTQLDRTAWTSDTAFRARGLAIDERALVIWGGGTDKLAIFDLADPKRPQFVRTVDVNNGPINDVAITNGWAIIASNDIAVLDLRSTTSTRIVLPDATWHEYALTIAGGFAYTATNNGNDGRIRIYDVSNPGSARYLREEALLGGLTWNALTSYGNYVVAISNTKTGGVGHDVVLIDRTNVYDLVKVADLDIPNFDATEGRVSGSRLYVTSSASRDLVIVDLANPKAPAVIGRFTLPANAGRSAALKTTAFVADTSAGLIEVDASNPAAPTLINTLATGGTAYDVVLASPTVYVANDIGLAVHPIAAPPQIQPSRVTMGVTAEGATITGSFRAITGSGSLTVEAKNVTTGTTSSANVNNDGSFIVSVAALANDAISIEATDAAGRKSGPVSLGLVPFGSGVTFTPFTSAIAGQGDYHARTIATDGTDLIVGGYNDDGSTRLVIFDSSDPAHPVFQRSVALNNGPINNVAIRNGWAIVAANDLSVLNLGSATSTPVKLPDATWHEYELLVRDGYAFTATNNGNDGRIRIYDVNNPASAHYVREQAMGTGTWTGLAAFGSRYLIATSGGAHDVVVIDRSNVYGLAKIADFDVPGFSGFRGRVVGSTFYLAGTGGGVAVVDLANPAAPVVKTILATGDARGIAAAGATVAVANGSAGVTFLNADDPNAPSVFGTQFVGGSAWSVAFNRDNVYVANDQGLAVISNLLTSPIVDPSRVSIHPETGTLATIAGSADSVTGLRPLKIEVRNQTSGASISNQSVAPDGSFSVLLSAMVNESLTVEATDAAGRKSGRVDVGRVPFGSAVTSFPLPAAVTGQNFHARTLATDGRHLVVGGYNDDDTTKIVVFDVTDPAAPQYVRTVALSDGPVNNVGISNGWAVVAANDLVVLDLSSTTSAPVKLPDATWHEYELLISGGYAFTGTNNGNDGRIRIYDVSRPSAARYVREEALGPVGIFWNGLTALDANHILAFSNDAAHDVVVIERSNIHNLVKLADIDIPNFNAFRGKVVGTTAYIAGTNGGLAIVDVSNPKTPVVLKVMQTAGSPFGADGAGALLAVADGGSGVTFVDITDPANASVIGTQAVGGTAWALAFNRGSIYVANELGLAVIANVGAAPIVAPSLITISTDGAGTATVTGATSAISGSGALVVEARNAESGDRVSNQPVNADGSFSVTIAAQPNDLLTIEATDEVGRKSGRTPVGTVPFGTVSNVIITPAMSAGGYRPRTLATDGTHLVIGGYSDDDTTRLVIFNVADPSVPPQFVRSVAINRGPINQVAIQDGWAIVAANDISVLNLNSTISTPVALPDETWYEYELLLSGGYAFTTTNNGNDGRIRVYDVASPAHARFVREQSMGIGDTTFTGLIAAGDHYLVATGTATHDVVVIDRRNIYALAKVADFDIPNFDAYRGKAIGTTLFLGGLSGGLAIVDLSNPAQPVVKAVLQTAGDAFGGDITGSTLAVADGSAGITFFDTTNPFAPQLLGTNPAGGGTVWSVQFSDGSLYAVNEQALIAIRNVTVPVIERSRISIATTTSTSITVDGAAGAIGGVAPFTIEVRNATTNATSGSVSVAANGSFSASLAAVPNDQLLLVVNDGGGRTSTLSLGRSPFGTLTTYPATPAQASGDGGFRARRIASNGTATITGTGSTSGIGVAQSGNVLVYRAGVAKKYDAGTAVHDIAIHGGYALIAGNDLASLNLADPNATPYVAPDATWYEYSVTASGTTAFTSTNNGNEGRIRVYDVTNPAKPTYVHEKAWVGGLTWEKLIAFGTYLIAIATDAPNGVGHDVVLFDATNRSALVKLADYDIPSFSALDGVVDGTTLYLAGGNAGVAIVDIATLTTPSPSVTIIDTPGNARGIDVSGTNEIVVADGSAGITIIDTTNRLQPVIRGTQALDKTNTVDVTVTGRIIHAASDGYVHTISRPE